MCGIAGSVRWDGANESDAVAGMTRALGHRGPDAEAVIHRAGATLGHRRLAVIDTGHAADQPMGEPERGAWLVFNGEIYNFAELRAGLEAEGESFATRSDTEVLLKGLSRHGAAFVRRLIGMFAFAFWDEGRRRLLLGRDRLGKKPLYLHVWSGGVVFASELAALRRHPRCAALPLEPAAIGHFVTLGYTLTGTCAVAGVEKLPPAHLMTLEQGRPSALERYWDLAASFRAKPRWRSEGAAVERLGELLDDAVRCRLVADVPLGAFLSGGLDSAALVEAMCRAEGPARVRTCTIGFEHKGFCEAAAAADTAAGLGVANARHDAGAAMARSLPEIVGFTDEPFADTSMIPFYHLSAFARRSVTVALSGDGGDELFAGYVTYVADKLQRGARFLPAPAARLLRAGAERFLKPSFGKVGFDYKLRQFLAGSALPPERAHFSWRTLFSDDERTRLFRPEHRDAAAADAFAGFAPHFAEAKGLHWLDQALYVDTKTWLVDDILVKADRMSMAHALEVRAPLLDHRLLEFAAGLPVAWKLNGFKKKWLLRRLMAQRFPRVLSRPKAGFNAPVSHWLLDELHDIARAATATAAMREWFRAEEIERLWVEHRDRRRDNGYRLFALTCLGLWLDRHGRAPC